MIPGMTPVKTSRKNRMKKEKREREKAQKKAQEAAELVIDPVLSRELSDAARSPIRAFHPAGVPTRVDRVLTSMKACVDHLPPDMPEDLRVYVTIETYQDRQKDFDRAQQLDRRDKATIDMRGTVAGLVGAMSLGPSDEQVMSKTPIRGALWHVMIKDVCGGSRDLALRLLEDIAESKTPRDIKWIFSSFRMDTYAVRAYYSVLDFLWDTAKKVKQDHLYPELGRLYPESW
jgi:hypothetical protein